MSKTASFWLVAAITAVVASPAAAQDADRDKARALIAQVMNGGQVVTAPPASLQPTGPTVELTSEQAVARALDKNLTLASQRITPKPGTCRLPPIWRTTSPISPRSTAPRTPSS